MKKILLGIALIFVVSSGYTSNQTILGITLGKSMPEQNINLCTEQNIYQTCYSIEGDNIFIHISDDESPKYIKDNILLLKQVNNRVEAIYFQNHGFSDEIEVLLALTKKYKKPNLMRENYTPHKTRNGEKITSIYAEWEIKDKFTQNIYITFDGVSPADVDRGTVRIKTQKYKELEDKIDLEEKSKIRKL